MIRIRCSHCGQVNEIGDPENLPRCRVCGGSLSTGQPVEDQVTDDNAAEAATLGAAGLDNAEGAIPYGSPCSCEDGGGPSAGNPAVCFQCGGILRDATSDEKSEEEETGFAPGPTPEFDRTGKRCVLALPGGRRVRVGDGVLVSRPDGVSPSGDPRVITVSARTVSRKHAWLRETDTGVEVMDLCSTNGTWIGGRRIESLRPVACTSDADIEVAFSRGLRAILSFVGGD